MEHAIRHQIKISFENNDPGLYQRFKDRLDNIITMYQGNWDQMLKELDDLHSDVFKGRPIDYRFNNATVQLPFYDVIKSVFDTENLDMDLDNRLVNETRLICKYIKSGIIISNFWEKPDEVKKITDKIASRFRMGGITDLKERDKELAAKLMLLAKNNYNEILRRINEME